MRKLIGMAAALAMLAGALYAQDIAGSWQGTLKAGRDFRLIVAGWAIREGLDGLRGRA